MSAIQVSQRVFRLESNRLGVICQRALNVTFTRVGVGAVAKNDRITEPKRQRTIKIVDGEVIFTLAVVSQAAIVEGQS